jgi:hypothetical protein
MYTTFSRLFIQPIESDCRCTTCRQVTFCASNFGCPSSRSSHLRARILSLRKFKFWDWEYLHCIHAGSSWELLGNKIHTTIQIGWKAWPNLPAIITQAISPSPPAFPEHYYWVSNETDQPPSLFTQSSFFLSINVFPLYLWNPYSSDFSPLSASSASPQSPRLINSSRHSQS